MSHTQCTFRSFSRWFSLLALLLLVGLTACVGPASSPPSGSGSSVRVVGRLLVRLSDGYIVGERREIPVSSTLAAAIPRPSRSRTGRTQAFLGPVEESAWREWIIGVFPGTPPEEVSSWIAPAGGRVIRPVDGFDAYLIAFERPRSLSDPAIERLLHEYPGIRYIDPNVTFTAQMWERKPNDPEFQRQYHLAMIGAPAAWGQLEASGGAVREVRVAIIDSGICPDHPDLPGPTRWWARSFVAGASSPYDCSTESHGTGVASVLAALTNNGVGIAGTFWDPTDAAHGNGRLILASARALVGKSGSLESVVRAMEEVRIGFGADIVNLSIGTQLDSGLLRDQVEAAASSGILIIAAAGNEDTGCEGICYPAAYPEVIAVGSVNSHGYRSSFSLTGPALDIVAPAEWIPMAAVDGGGSPFYPEVRGTSFAAPAVAGVAAMLMASGLDDPEAVRDVLLFSARSTGPYDKWRDGRSPEYGWGLLDAYAALALRNRPEVFLARKVSDSFERVGPVVYPSPNGYFQLTANPPQGEPLYVAGWVDADRNGRLSAGDYFGVSAQPVLPPGGNVGDIIAAPVEGFW